MILSASTAVRLLCVLSLVASAASAQFTPPTQEELSMTSIPQVPGAPAVYLYREETVDDSLRMFSYYTRLKVLTDGGKEYANVELPFASGSGNAIDSISGRTIHPDGSITPFTGKPYDKLIEKSQGYKVMAKVFTLPAVEVGSILEYRYKTRYDDAYFQSPRWFIQSELYTRKGHYEWKPTGQNVITSDERGETLNSVAWTPILPPGAKVIQTDIQGKSFQSGGNYAGNTKLTLDVHDIEPLPQESNMPPVNSLSYRVLFYYTSYKTSAEFWTREGKRWSKQQDKFIGSSNEVGTMAKSLITAGAPQSANLKKIYDAVQQFENTDYSRQKTKQEEHAAGLKPVNNAEDVLRRKRGTSDQLAELFVAMARAAGMKAYVMGVTNRQYRLFLKEYLSLGQLDDIIAVVNVDGKEEFFDPGERLCTFGHLAWKHTLTAGLRQAEGGNVSLSSTPSEPYSAERTSRIADLTVDEHGLANGTVTVTRTGDTALYWRHRALIGDDTSLNTELRTAMEGSLPGGMEVRVTDVANLNDPDKPLTIKYEVKGAVGSATGKRLLLPQSLFEVNHRPEFTQPKRELAVDMHHAEIIQDAVRFKYPTTWTVESVPAEVTAKMTNAAVFSSLAKQAPGSVTLYRNYTVGKVFFSPEEYPDLRTFFEKLESKQAESLILTRAVTTAVASPTGN